MAVWEDSCWRRLPDPAARLTTPPPNALVQRSSAWMWELNGSYPGRRITMIRTSVVNDFDIIIDFTRPSAGPSTVAQQYGKRIVIGTTGFDDAGKEAIRQASAQDGNCVRLELTASASTWLQLLEQAAKVMGRAPISRLSRVPSTQGRCAIGYCSEHGKRLPRRWAVIEELCRDGREGITRGARAQHHRILDHPVGDWSARQPSCLPISASGGDHP